MVINREPRPVVDPRWLTRTWGTCITALFEATDRWDFDAFGDYLSQAVHCQLGNTPAVHGLDAMIEFARHYRDAVSHMHHSLDLFVYDIERRRVAVEATVTYVRLDDVTKTYPAAVIVGFDQNNLIDSYHVFVDLSDLFAGSTVQTPLPNGSKPLRRDSTQ